MNPKKPKASNILMEVKLRVADERTCQAAMSDYKITKGMLCAGGEKNKDACQVKKTSDLLN